MRRKRNIFQDPFDKTYEALTSGDIKTIKIMIEEHSIYFSEMY
jgi:hypothetical protein